MRELFIYYRVPCIVVAEVLSAVRQMQARLREEEPALIARVLRRTGGDDENETWMETYATHDAGEGLTAALQARIEARALALQPLIDGARHTEVFFACAS
jgi:hypothetical protein